MTQLFTNIFARLRSLLPYNKYCVRTLFERLLYPNGRNIAKTPARRSRRFKSNEGQSNKCSVSSMPSFEGHIGFKVEIVLEFMQVQFTETNPELS